jgi:hypothetical protein
MRTYTLTLAVLLAAAGAAADSLFLNNGVRVDGKVTVLPNGLYQVTAGGRKTVYRPDEIARHEENDRSGVIDRQEARRRFEERDAILTRETGLNVDQRRRVGPLVDRLQREDERPRARTELAVLQQEMDVFRYLAYLQPAVSHRLAPWILEAMAAIDAQRALPDLRRNLVHTFYGTRAVAIEILGRMHDRRNAAEIARGLADHAPEVQFVTAYALADLGLRQATPALIELLGHADPRVRNASAEALAALWEGATGGAIPESREQWQHFWESQAAGVPDAIPLAALTPLVPVELEFQDE